MITAVWIKANQMPPVENKFCDDRVNKKRALPIGRALPGFQKQLADFGDVCSLRSFLTLDDLEFDFVAFGERLETASTDGAEMNEDVRSALP